MSQKSFYRRNQSFLVLVMGVSLCLGTAWVLAQEAPSRSFPDSPYLRIDPEKIRGAEVCGECHAEEAELWMETKHQTQFATLHQSEKAQNILDNMGFRLAKRESLCLRCHYTATVRRDQARAVTGVSCESCHGAGRDYIDIHNDYGGATHDTETEAHRLQRIQGSIEGGMLRPSGDIYAVAANCFECHTVPDERLINEGGHPSGSKIELVAWSDSIRHNFLAAQWSSDRSNRVPTMARNRLLYVVGQILDYEYSLRGLANATKRSPYSKAMERRTKVAYRDLKDIFRVVPLSELNEILNLGRSITIGPNNESELVSVADRISPIVERLSQNHDWESLAELDPLVSGPSSTSTAGIVDESDDSGSDSDSDSETTAPEPDGDDEDDTSVPDQTESDPVSGGAAIEGRILSRPAWFQTEQYQTTVPGCSCHTNAEEWLLDDTHSQSFDLMSSPRAIQIAQVYGINPAERHLGNRICMSCHGTVVSGDELEEVFDPVTCESCHGPSSGYLDPHERGSGAGFSLGQRRLKNAEDRAVNCSRCHYITDERLLAAGHPTEENFDLSEKSQTIKHWPDTKNVKRDSPYPELSASSLTSAMASVKTSRPVPFVNVVQVQPAPTTPSVTQSTQTTAPRPTSGDFQRPQTLRTSRRSSSGSLQLPPLPEVDDSTSTEELLLIVKRRLERIYKALGRGN